MCPKACVIECHHTEIHSELGKSAKAMSLNVLGAQSVALFKNFLFLTVLSPIVIPSGTLPMNSEGFLCIHGPMSTLFNIKKKRKEKKWVSHTAHGMSSVMEMNDRVRDS